MSFFRWNRGRCRSLVLFAFGLLCMVLLLRSTPAPAAARWYVKPGGTGDGTSWAKASADLADVLNRAGYHDEIWVAAGTYRPTEDVDDRSASFVLRNWKELYGGFRGTETSREQRDPVRNRTILTGDLGGDDVVTEMYGFVGVTINGNNAFHVVYCAGAGVLDGFTIIGGNANGDALQGRQRLGGGMFNDVETCPTVANCSFIGNRAAGSGAGGAGMFNDSMSCPTVTNCTFNGNDAVTICHTEGASRGGAMYNICSSPTVTNCSFFDNSAEKGGAIYDSTSASTVTNCTFYKNRASNGGDGFCSNCLCFTVKNCIFSNSGYREILYDDWGLGGDSGIVTHCLVDGGYEGGTDIIAPYPWAGLDFPSDARGPWPLRPDSPAIDAGTADGAPSTDQRGVARPQGAGVDIGAYELEATNSAVPPLAGGGSALEAIREGSASADLPEGMSAGDLNLVAFADLEDLRLEELGTGDAADAVESAEPGGKFLCGVSFDVTVTHDVCTDLLPVGLQLPLSKDRFFSTGSFNAIAEDEEEVGLAEAVLTRVAVLKSVGGEAFDLVDVARSANCDPRDFFSVSRDEEGNILVGLELLVADAPAGEVPAVQAVPASGDCRFLVLDGAEDGHYRDPVIAVEKDCASGGNGGCNAPGIPALGLLLVPLLVLLRK